MATTPSPDQGPPQYTHDALVAGLAVKATELEQAAEDLRTAYRFSRQLKAILLIGLILSSALIFLTLQNRGIASAVRSCTTPQGSCYEQAQSSQGKAVAQIVAAVDAHTDLVFIATLECSQRTPFSQKKFESCMASKGVTIH